LPHLLEQIVLADHGVNRTIILMLVAFSITPLGGSDSVSGSVAEAVRLVRASGLPNETNAMFTNVEGEWDEVMDLLKSCVEKVAETAPRVSVVVKLDYRPGHTNAMQHKVEAVEEHLR
jgi:uncharacterized protein (TIGR00106 family)